MTRLELVEGTISSKSFDDGLFSTCFWQAHNDISRRKVEKPRLTIETSLIPLCLDSLSPWYLSASLRSWDFAPSQAATTRRAFCICFWTWKSRSLVNHCLTRMIDGSRYCSYEKGVHFSPHGTLLLWGQSSGPRMPNYPWWTTFSPVVNRNASFPTFDILLNVSLEGIQ